MLSLSFIVNLIRIATFVIFAVILEKMFYNRKLNKTQKLIFKYNCRRNVSSYIIIGLSIATMFSITESSYIYVVNKAVANYGPWLFLIIGVFLSINNYKFNKKLINSILKK